MLQTLNSQCVPELNEKLRKAERNVSLVYTLFKTSVYYDSLQKW